MAYCRILLFTMKGLQHTIPPLTISLSQDFDSFVSYQDVVYVVHDSSQKTKSGIPSGNSVSTGDALKASGHVLANLNKDSCFIWTFKCLIKRWFNNTLTLFF